MAQSCEKVVLSAGDIFFVYKLKKALEAQDCKVFLAPGESEIFNALHEAPPNLLILDLEDIRKNPSVIIQGIRKENKLLRDLPILAYTVHDRILEWEEKIKEDRILVVSDGFISTYISNYEGLKAMFNA